MIKKLSRKVVETLKYQFDYRESERVHTESMMKQGYTKVNDMWGFDAGSEIMVIVVCYQREIN